MKNNLKDALEEYAKSDFYPFHMPGHKRNKLPFPNPYEIDITEIDGFDNLHQPEGILKDAQKRAAELYGAEQSFYLVNGSTCGILAAICAAVHKGDKIIAARNCHKSVYHAILLHELRAEYIYPEITENGILGQITPEQVKTALAEHSDAAAVVLTSPTYEGIVSDVETIAKICHSHHIPLIVDEAHGAHLGFGAGFPENAVKLGADAVIMSLHKTLPSFTQTALLHVRSEFMDINKVKTYLDIFQTSSPSYLFLAGMDECIRLLAEKGEELFCAYRANLSDFYKKTADLNNLHVMTAADFAEKEAYDWDDSKIVIFSEQAKELSEILLKKYHLQMEMVSGYYILGMTSIFDKKEGFKRLSDALHEIDRTWSRDISGAKEFIKKIYQKNPYEMHSFLAAGLPHCEVEFEQAVGKVCAGMICLYPPGIPLAVWGERITRELTEHIRQCQDMGLCVEGVRENFLNIVYF